MKTWIIILLIAWIVFEFISRVFAALIKSDPEERMRYHFTGGATKLGVFHALFGALSTLCFWADVILFIIFILGKL